MNFKLLLTLTTLLLSQIILSQNEELDKRGGFKTIKLGESLDNFSEFKKISEDNGLIKGVWMTDDDDLNYLFELKINLFKLEFDSKTKKLVKLIVFITEAEKADTEKFNYLEVFSSKIETFNYALGKAIKCDTENLFCWWLGDKIGMQWSYEKESYLVEDGKKYSIETLRLTYMDIPYFENKVNKGF